MRASCTAAPLRPRLMHVPTNAWLDHAGLGACDAAQHGVRRLRAQRARRLAAHPQRLARRRGAVARGHDAGVVDAGQRLVGEQPAQRVGAQSAGGGQLRHAEARRPDGHRARAHGAVGEHHRVRADLRHHVGLEHRDAHACASTWRPTVGPRSDSDGASSPPQTNVTLRPCSASSEAVSMPVSPAPTTVTGASGCSSSRRRAAAAPAPIRLSDRRIRRRRERTPGRRRCCRPRR